MEMTMVVLRRLFVVLALLSTIVQSDGASQVEEQQEFIISGYWPEFRTNYDINATALYLTDLMLHSIDPTADGGIEKCCLTEENYLLAQQAKAHKMKMTGKDLRIWLAVGGWGRSNGFEGLLADEASKKRFLFSLKKLCLKYDIGGIDFDWQEPVTREATLDFYKLLRTAKKMFGKIDVKVGVALNRGRQLPTRIYEHVDRVHLLSYEIDLMGGAYHADFDKVRDAAKSFVTGNCPPKKLTLGLPLYSRITEQPGHMRTIDEMVTEQAEGDVNIILNAESEYNEFVFDTPKRIKQKVRLALEMGLGGVHFWELGQDHIDAERGPGGIMMQAVLDAQQEYADERAKAVDNSDDEL